jgi:hypothetical protein
MAGRGFVSLLKFCLWPFCYLCNINMESMKQLSSYFPLGPDYQPSKDGGNGGHFKNTMCRYECTTCVCAVYVFGAECGKTMG